MIPSGTGFQGEAVPWNAERVEFRNQGPPFRVGALIAELAAAGMNTCLPAT